MLRGEVWTSAARADFSGNPRPVVIVQHSHFLAFDSVTICGFTTDPTELPLFRVEIEPRAPNGLETKSRVMADKVLTVSKSRLGQRLGRLSDRDMVRVDQALRIFLGLTG